MSVLNWLKKMHNGCTKYRKITGIEELKIFCCDILLNNYVFSSLKKQA